VGRRLVGRPDEQHLSTLAARPLHPSLDAPPTDSLTNGRKAFQEGRHSEALHYFSQILEENPDHAWAWHGRGDALQLMGAWQDALTAYERAIAIQPEEPLHREGRKNARQAIAQSTHGADETSQN